MKATIQEILYAAELKVIPQTFGLLLPTLKSKPTSVATSDCIYKFTCTCGAGYLGRTERRLETRIAEHIPKYLGKPSSATNRQPASSIGEHLLETGHRVDVNRAFKVLLKATSPRLLRFAEALSIHRFKHSLCVQKQLYVSLHLPW